MSEPLLHEHITAKLDSITIDVTVTLRSPWTVLFGPSGSGKSTILRRIAGLRGGIPAWKRHIPLASQQAALFPHMTVKGNLEFGRELPTRNFEQEEELHAERFQDLVRLFRIGDLLDRYPAQLSGGQAQRVNVARALMPRYSRLVLLDEPFTGLEQALRNELLLALKQWTREHRLPVLSVTHDVTEALLLEAEVIKLHEGRIVAQGPAQEVLAEERLQLLRSLNGSRTFTL